MTRLPRLLDADLREITPLRPVKYSLMDTLTPLSTAKLTVGGDAGVKMRDFVELFVPDGSAGVFRVNNLRREGCELHTLSLQHGLCTLSDHMHPGKSSETGSCRTLLTKILSNQTRWTLGTVEVPDDKELTWECDNTNDLQGLLSVLKELPEYCLDFDQTQQPWVLHVLAKPTEIDCECRFDRNLSENISIEYDDADMCTVAYADGLDSPFEADTIGTWGRIERPVSVDEDLGAELIEETVRRYLDQTKEPRCTITLPALELSRLTGEPIDSFRKGQLCRCILPDMTVVQRIESIERPDPIGEPDYVVLTLASTQNDLSVTVAGMVVDIRHVNQLYQQVEKDLKIQADTIEMLAAEIALRATKIEVDGLSDRISVAEIELNEVLGQLELKVDYNDHVADINEVHILLDAVNGTLEAKADLILLDGYVKTSELETEMLSVTEYLYGQDVDIGSLVAASINTEFLSADSITTDSLGTSDLSVGGTSASWKNQSVLTGKPTITKSKRTITVQLADGSTGSIEVLTDMEVSYPSVSIKYLGGGD